MFCEDFSSPDVLTYLGNSTRNTTSNSTVAKTELPFDLPWWQQFFFITIFSLMFLIATGGNVIVIWIVLAHKRMRTVTNYFLVNLAVADTLISILNTLFTFTYLMSQDWWYGEIYCKFTNFISICTITASVLTFMAIAIDRYMAIIHPLRPRVTGRVILAIVIIWTVSVILSFPMMVYGEVCDIQVPDGTIINACRIKWAPGIDFAYNVLILFVTYLLPITTLAVAYSRIGVELWGSRAIGENTPVQYERVKSKRKVVKMMIMVVIIFGICWLPYHLYFLLNTTTSINTYRFIQQIYLIIYWMAMSNSMYNPIIYCWMNAKFRQGFMRVFCCCPFAPCKKMRRNIRHGRTLFPTGHDTMTEKHERNGSLMQTMTEYMDEHSSSSTKKDRRKGRRDSDDYL